MKFLIAALILNFAPVVLAGPSPIPRTQVVALRMTDKGFDPSHVDVKLGTSVTLKVTRLSDSICTAAIQIPALKIRKDLPVNQAVTIELGKLSQGKIRFACGMNMMEGHIQVQ